MKIRHKTALSAVPLSSFASLLGLMAAPLAVAAEGEAAAVPAQVADTKQDSAGGIEEIVVTAQKRAEKSQSVPVAITALSGSDLASRGDLDTESLVKAVPGLNATITAGYAGKLNFTLRGVGTNTFSEVDEAGIAWISPFEDGTGRISKQQEYDTCPDLVLCLCPKSRYWLCNAGVVIALKRSSAWSRRPISLE